MWSIMARKATAGSGSGDWNWHAATRQSRAAMIRFDYLLLDVWLVHDVDSV